VQELVNLFESFFFEIKRSMPSSYVFVIGLEMSQILLNQSHILHNVILLIFQGYQVVDIGTYHM
jgi:hypothetical protein